MAIKNVRIDDIDGTEGATTHSFSLDQDRWQIDIVDSNLQQIKEALAPFAKHARKIGQSSKSKRVRTKGSQNPENSQAIRDWAEKNGHKVNSRGRIPQDVQDLFDAAHAGKPLSQAV